MRFHYRDDIEFIIAFRSFGLSAPFAQIIITFSPLKQIRIGCYDTMYHCPWSSFKSAESVYLFSTIEAFMSLMPNWQPSSTLPEAFGLGGIAAGKKSFLSMPVMSEATL